MKSLKNLFIITTGILIFICNSCKKPNNDQASTGTEAEALADFATVLVNPNYQDLQTKTGILNTAVQTLSTAQTDANLVAAQVAWRNARLSWESAEGYLFGPVEDFNYDPSMDSWPVNQVELDSLLNSNSSLSIADIDSQQYYLKGFHAIEYVLFGPGSSRTASQITPREMLYVVSLTQSVYNTTVAIVNSWAPGQGNFTAQVVNAGNGSTRFTTRKAAFLALVGAMSGICDEVANNKIQTPFAAQDSTQDESAFSHNTTADYKANITGVLNAYLCKWTTTGHGLNQLVSANNISLDDSIQNEINTAINSFNAITVPFEQAIYTQKTQIVNTQNAILKLKSTIDGSLTNYINTYIKD